MTAEHRQRLEAELAEAKTAVETARKEERDLRSRAAALAEDIGRRWREATDETRVATNASRGWELANLGTRCRSAAIEVRHALEHVEMLERFLKGDAS